MSQENKPRPDAKVDQWDRFWRGDKHDAAVTANPAEQSGLSPHWQGLLSAEASARKQARLVDLACGTGAATGEAIAAFKAAGTPLDVHCVDFSPAAVEAVAERFKGIETSVGDCTDLPFDDHAFDLVMSQFGIEYAGLDAFSEAARLVAPGGTLLVMSHFKGGAIDRECTENGATASAILESNVLPTAKAAFTAISRFNARQISQQDLASQHQALTQAAGRLREVSTASQSAASELAGRIFHDLGQMFQKPDRFALQDTLDWCDNWHAEVSAYLARMQAMTQAALSEDQVTVIHQLVSERGLVVDSAQCDRVRDGAETIAWCLKANRQSG